MCSVLHRVANSSWFTQNFPGFSTISWENPQSLTNQDGWSSYCYKKNDVCYVKKKTGDTIINAEVLNAKFVCSNTSQFLLIGKKKKKDWKPHLPLPPFSLSFYSPKTVRKGVFLIWHGWDVSPGLTVEMVTTITQQAPAPSFSRTGNVIFRSLRGAHLKTNQDNLWFRLSRASI